MFATSWSKVLKKVWNDSKQLPSCFIIEKKKKKPAQTIFSLFLTDNMEHIRSDERLPSSEADLVHPLLDEEASQGQHLRGG